MKNDYCDLNESEINKLPIKYQGFLSSPFQFNLENGMISVPEDTFKGMVDIIAEVAKKELKGD